MRYGKCRKEIFSLQKYYSVRMDDSVLVIVFLRGRGLNETWRAGVGQYQFMYGCGLSKLHKFFFIYFSVH